MAGAEGHPPAKKARREEGAAPSQFDQLAAMTTIVADTGEIEAIKK